jgi:capsular polysaccharide transport system permease protein
MGPRARQRALREAMAGAGDRTEAETGPETGPESGPDTGPETGPMPLVEADSTPAMGLTVETQRLPTPVTDAPPALIGDEPAGDDGDDAQPAGKRRNLVRADRRPARPQKQNDPSHYVVAPTVSPARMRPRHWGVIALFVLCVIVPTISYSWYLWTRAADQYESALGFGSRTEEGPATFDFLGALGGGSQSGSKDMDILNQFVISQELVAKLDARLDLKTLYAKPEGDPLNAFHAGGTIEDLVAFWQRMVLIDYDNGTGLMNIRIFAFDPADARNIAGAVLAESTAIINKLSQTAQEDTTRYSKEALTATEDKLAEARLAVLDYQLKNNIVDPTNVVANQLSVVSTLNQQMTTAQIELDMLAGTVPAADPRVATLERRIEVIRNRIAEEQAKVGATADANSPGFAKLMAEFERLKVDLDFAQRAYLSALAAHDQALSDAQKKTRYLATYVTPTLAEAPTAPNRPLTAALVALAGFLLWSILVLTYYALRDRR